MERGVLIELDSRGRLSLRRLAEEDDRYFLAQKRPDGSILLMPADVAPRRRVVGPDHTEVIADEIVDLRDRMKSDDSPKKSLWWEQRREQQRQNARGQ